jgi:methyl-accepting chemotaxis protein
MGQPFSFTNLPIAQRLGIGFSLAGVLAVIIALAVGIANTGQLRQATDSFDQALRASNSLAQVKDSLRQIHGSLEERLALGASAGAAPLSASIIKLSDDLEQHFGAYLAVVDQTAPQVTAFQKDWTQYKQLAQKDASLIDNNQLEQARTDVAGAGESSYTAVLKDITGLESLSQKAVDTARETASQGAFASVWGALAWALVGFFVVMFLAWFIVFSIIRQLEELLGLTRRVNRGDLSQRAHVQGRSEVSVVAASMNDMLDTIGDLLVKEESLRTDLEAQIERLIGDVTPVGYGDLRLHALVTNSQIGTLADVFNVIIEQLATLVSRVQSSATLAYSAAGSIVKQASNLAKAADHLSNQLGQANEGMGQLAGASANVAVLARTSLVTANESATSAQRGGQAVLQVLDRVKRSTKEIQAIEHQMASLSEHSKEISAIVSLIEEIAKQTQLISLNATVQADQAGSDFSRGFGVVADEIRRLAVRTEEAVHQITGIVRTFQGDIYGVSVTTEQAARDFVKLAELADEASSVLQGIWTRVPQQAQDIHAITEVATWQEKVAGQAAVMIHNLAVMSQRMGETALEQEAAARNLSEMSQALRASIAAFRLPAGSQAPAMSGPQHNGLGGPQQSAQLAAQLPINHLGRS